jgi:hypothetical protein
MAAVRAPGNERRPAAAAAAGTPRHTMTDEDTETGIDGGRRRALGTVGAGLAALLAGCTGEDGPDTPTPTTATPADSGTETATETATPTPEPLVVDSLPSFEAIVRTQIAQVEDPIVGGQEARTIFDTMQNNDTYAGNEIHHPRGMFFTEVVRRAADADRTGDESDAVMPHVRYALFSEAGMNFDMDDVSISHRRAQNGGARPRVWDAEDPEGGYLINSSGLPAEAAHANLLPNGTSLDERLRENGSDGNSSVNALAQYQAGAEGNSAQSPFDPAGVREYSRENAEEADVPEEQYVQNAADFGRRKEFVLQSMFERVRFEMGNGEVVDTGLDDYSRENAGSGPPENDVDTKAAFGWHLGEDLFGLERSQEFFKRGTEYITHISMANQLDVDVPEFEGVSSYILFGYEVDFRNYDSSMIHDEDKTQIIDHNGETVMAATVEEELYDQALAELYLDEQALEFFRNRDTPDGRVGV